MKRRNGTVNNVLFAHQSSNMRLWGVAIAASFLASVIICFAYGDEESDRANVRIGIVGGGIAGLVAANRLIAYGFTNVSILEATDRLGGRIYPVQFESGYLQLGAEFINGRNNQVYKLAEKLKLLDGIFDPINDMRFVTGKCQVLDTVVDSYFEFAMQLEDKYRTEANTSSANVSRTVGELYEQDYQLYLEQLGADPKSAKRRIVDSLSHLFRASFESEWSAPWNDLSIKNLVSWNVAGKEVHSMDRHGFKSIIDYLKEPLPPSSIKLNHRATFIDYGTHAGVKVSFRSHDHYHFYDHLIVTMPLGHLKKYAYHNFRPPLPIRKQAAIDKLGFGTIGKVFFIYKQPFWDPTVAIIVPLSVPNCSSTLQGPEVDAPFYIFQTYRWNRKILLGWLSGDGPLKVGAMTDNELKSAVTALFRRLYNNDSIPMPDEIYRNNWANDNLFGGTYSYISVASAEANTTFKDLARPIYIRGVPRLLFAGEATHDSIYQTTVGAWYSGRREATRLFRYYKKLSHNSAPHSRQITISIIIYCVIARYVLS